MTGKSHIAVGVASVLLADSLTGFTTTHPVAAPISVPFLSLGLALAGAVIGSLLPDIDHPESKIAYQAGLARGRGPLTDVAGFGLRALMGGHRGFTHSALVASLIAIAGLLILQPAGAAAIGFALGYLSHIAADMLTKEGVRLWWPFSRREVGIGPRALRFRTGSLIEYAIVAALWVVTLAAYWGATNWSS